MKRKFKAIKIYKPLLQLRGGDLKADYTFYQYKLGAKLRKFILKLLSLLKSKELYANSAEAFTKKFLYAQLRIVLQLLLERYKIKINYLFSTEFDSEVIAIAVVSGSASGVVSVWIPILRILIAPTALFSTLGLKSVIHQSFKSVKSLSRWASRRRICHLLKDEKIHNKFCNLLLESQQ